MSQPKRIFADWFPLLFSAVCLAFLCAELASAEPLLPGKGVGKITLGMTQAAALKLLGTPTAMYTRDPQVTGAYWMSRSGRTLRIFFGQGKVIQISENAPAFKTSRGVSIQSSLADIEKAYPHLSKHRYFIHGSGGGIIEYYDAVQQGIAFSFSGPESEAPQLTLYAIQIHPPGKPVLVEKDESLQP